jgi:hypothetical protein
MLSLDFIAGVVVGAVAAGLGFAVFVWRTARFQQQGSGR